MFKRHGFGVLVLCCGGLLAGVARAQPRQLGNVDSYEHSGAVIDLRCGDAHLRLDAISEHIVRVRFAPDGAMPRDFSWAVENRNPAGWFTEVFVNDNVLVFSTSALSVVISRNPCRLNILDDQGNALVEDDPARGVTWENHGKDGGAPFRVWQQLPDGVSIFGLGEKTGGMHRENRAWSMWNTDEGAYGATTDPIYVSVPFFIAASGERYHGVFLDNPWRTSFDFGRTHRNRLSFGAEGGALDYYIIAGPHPADVIRRYTDLTGRMTLPPKWAIGYHQCRYSYSPETRVRQVARTFREKRIPCDVLYFDIDYMDGYRCFTWNRERFPDPAGMMDDLHALGFRTIAIIDPGIKNEPGYAAYDSGSRIDAWLTRPDGEPYVGRVWPGDCVFPDFTADAVRDWWADLFPAFIASSGLDGVWNDMNEPANFAGPNKTVPLDLRHDNAGKPASHRACHNIYGMQMTRATREGLQRARPTRRPFTLTRANYAGGQKYGAIWTGDNISSWEHLAMSIPMILGSGVSGMPFVGPDIGGFIGGPSPELYARWLQVGALFPFSRTHTSCNNADQEPWSFGPRVEAIARASLERRYEWMPYLYTLFEEASRTGLPIMRPIWLEQPGYDGWKLDSAFFLGPDIFVSPKLTPGEKPHSVELPNGVWFDGNTGEIHGGGRWIRIDGSLETLPHFFRAGAIVPMQSVVQHTGERPREPLILDVWPFGDSTGTLYEDDGLSLAHREGAYRRTTFRCSVAGDRIVFDIEASRGAYAVEAPPPLVRLHHVVGEVEQVQFSTREVPGAGDAPHVSTASTETADELAPGTFHFDPCTGELTARMFQSLGEAQHMEVMLAPFATGSPEPIVLDFDGQRHALRRPRGCSAVEYDAAGARFTVRWSGTARVALPRLRVPLDALPMLTLRVSTEHARRVELRFATESDPARTIDGLAIELIPDGEFHDCRVDLRKHRGNPAHGSIYRMELEFTDGIRGNEMIRIARVAFEADG